MLNAFLKPTGFVLVVDGDGNKIEQLCKPWTEALPFLLKMLPKAVKWYFGDVNCEISKETAQFLWLSLCRDEELIAASIKVLQAMHGKNNLSTNSLQALAELEACLKQRGRIA